MATTNPVRTALAISVAVIGVGAIRNRVS